MLFRSCGSFLSKSKNLYSHTTFLNYICVHRKTFANFWNILFLFASMWRPIAWISQEFSFYSHSALFIVRYWHKRDKSYKFAALHCLYFKTNCGYLFELRAPTACQCMVYTEIDINMVNLNWNWAGLRFLACFEIVIINRRQCNVKL